ncbi:MAG: hypothetical protein K9H13_08075, partial [Bacteroidales bacterium]|nr:hypothetical protein [Bacteroidales bacterium]
MIKKHIQSLNNLFAILLFVFSIAILLFDLGFDQNDHLENLVFKAYIVVFCLEIANTLTRLMLRWDKIKRFTLAIDFFLLVFLAAMILTQFEILAVSALNHKFFWVMGLTLVFFRELVAFSFRVTRSLLNPAQLFIS